MLVETTKKLTGKDITYRLLCVGVTVLTIIVLVGTALSFERYSL